jgi:D-alanyl-D-alanine dipeptidase
MPKPYLQIPIHDNGEPLVPIPAEDFDLISPHPYQALGAPYGDKSPFYVRQGVLEALMSAQTELNRRHPGWKIQIFDAYRPLAVQQFMVDYTFNELVMGQGKKPADLTETERQFFLEQVYQFWALPSFNPATPPPHSTGAAVDVTLMNDAGTIINMGSPIDEVSPRSFPHHFAESLEIQEQQYHHNRHLLNEVMFKAGFQRHPNEWWHFCYGDQMWAWLCRQASPHQEFVARYGRVE